ncbi:alpha/beta-hydrolase [Epithele typhae]|uniref:alpha/beta-hydrolase n=1 Tax=Epithele typhae TaxID=378194 RepID=UPI002008558E|nr:alpha/beta-hydrolase [Epithele typhae]KAH9935089.1 alpha/beta-hydrolase [Epithele typhae]
MHFTLNTLLGSALLALRVAAVPFPVPAPAPLAPAPVSDLETRADTASLVSAAQMSSYKPFTQFARAAYCDGTGTWSCGAACRANPTFQPTLTGGDGNAVQFYYVGYWPDQNAVIVSYQGTDPTQLLADLTDLDFFQQPFDSSLFPGVPSSVQVHGGFADQHAKAAAVILKETKRLISAKGATTVITVGHSLGGALAEIAALHMTLNLPSSIHVKSVTYGTPRVGNPAYASFFDGKVADFVRINHDHDPIPIVPGRGLGFQHVHGEIHILDSNGQAYACSPDDNASSDACTISTVPNIFVSNILDHLGPYGGIYLGTIAC